MAQQAEMMGAEVDALGDAEYSAHQAAVRAAARQRTAEALDWVIDELTTMSPEQWARLAGAVGYQSYHSGRGEEVGAAYRAGVERWGLDDAESRGVALSHMELATLPVRAEEG